MAEILSILAIDDSEDDRMLYRRTLQKSMGESFRMLEAGDGEQGLTLVTQEQPACVLLDYSMPGRNGIEILRRMRGKHPFVPVVMLTGQGNEVIAVSAIQEGAQHYISKARITPDALERVVRQAIEHCALQKRIHEQRTSLEIFTHALAHDLKEPMRTIRSFLKLITERETFSEKGLGYFNHVQNAAQRMDKLIDTVHLYTKLDTIDHIPKETCSAAGILDEVRENLDQLTREREAVILSGALPDIHVNRTQLIQVLQNLIANAVRHGEAGVTIHVQATEREEHWQFSVSDNGPGIGAEYVEKIFEPFRRLAYQGQGLGLGLAICRKVIESHGGRIWCESTPGAGAAFLFTLPKLIPATQEKAAIIPVAITRALPVGGEQRLASLLLVDDSEADIELARILLVEQGHMQCNLLVARDGQEALKVMRAEAKCSGAVDLILLDINMPGMNGFELLERIRAEEELRQVEVVIYTTSNYEKDVKQAESLGVKAYLTKPAEFGRLKTIIDKVTSVQLCKSDEGYSLLRSVK